MSRSQVLTLARRHEVLHGCPKVLVAVIFTGVFAVNLITFRALQAQVQVLTGGLESFLLEAVLLVGFVTTLLHGAAGRRCRPWEAALPIPSYQLWRSHWLALVLSGFATVGLTAAAIIGFVLLLRGAIDRPLLTDAQLVRMLVRPLLLVITGAGLVALRRLELTDLEDDRGWRTARVGIAASLYGALIVLQWVPLVLAIVPVLLVTVALLRARGRLPQVLESWPAGATASAGRADAEAAEDGTPASPAFGSVATRVVLRQLFKWPASWIMMPPFLLGGGLLLAGFLPFHPEAGFDDQSMRLMNFWIVVYILLAVVGHFVENLWRVDHLPLSRARLLAWAVLPNLVAMLLGYALGVGILEYQKSRHDEIELLANRDHLFLDVPLEFFDLGWGDDAPAIEGPDGRPIEAFSRPLLPGQTLMVYNTFHLPAGSSREFTAWQIARAVQAVYGVTIPAQEIRDRYLTIDADGNTAPVKSGLTLRADYPELHTSYRGPVFPLEMGLLLVVFLLVLGLLFLAARPGTTTLRWRIYFWGAMILLMALHIGGFGTLIVRWTEEWAVSATVLILARRIGEAGPVAIGLTWAVAAAAVVGAWSFALGRFRRLEAPRGK